MVEFFVVEVLEKWDKLKLLKHGQYFKFKNKEINNSEYFLTDEPRDLTFKKTDFCSLTTITKKKAMQYNI